MIGKNIMKKEQVCHFLIQKEKDWKKETISLSLTFLNQDCFMIPIIKNMNEIKMIWKQLGKIIKTYGFALRKKLKFKQKKDLL